jgi:hypothetical protein
MHHDQMMKSYTQLTPLNNYLSNCVIKLHIKLQVHQEEVHNTFLNSKGNWVLSMDFKLFQNWRVEDIDLSTLKLFETTRFKKNSTI